MAYLNGYEYIKLNKDMGKVCKPHGFELDPTKKYIIKLSDELESQISIMQAFMIMGDDGLLSDWHKWLDENGFDSNIPNPTNKYVEKFFGKEPLWKNERSQALVIKNYEDDDFYIVMECGRTTIGYKYTKVILTLGGCL